MLSNCYAPVYCQCLQYLKAEGKLTSQPTQEPDSGGSQNYHKLYFIYLKNKYSCYFQKKMKAKYLKFTLLETLYNVLWIWNNIVTNITLSLLVHDAAQPDVENITKYL